MINKMTLWVSLCIALCSIQTVSAQEVNKDSIPEEFKIDLEFRPRSEFRNGYRYLRNDTTKPAFFTEGRSRLYFTYSRKGFIFHTSIQDIRFWGSQDPRSRQGTLQVFEAYVEPTLTKNLSMRIGRQKIMYDNQRLFAQNDWRQNAGAHDGVRFMFRAKKLETDFFGAFNAEEERFFETDFSPSGWSNYKILLVHYLRYKPTDKLTFTTINASDVFQNTVKTREHYWRFTSGGRAEYTTGQMYFTFSGYYQYGHTPTGLELSAYYFQPEIKFDNKKLIVRLGAEVFSGDNGEDPEPGTSHSFDALYGVNHRFLGTMDYFIRFPSDLNGAGLYDPYFFVYYNVTKKIQLRAENHLFFSQNNFVSGGVTIDKYLGFENDLLMVYKPNDFTTIDLGFSWMAPTESMELIKPTGGTSDRIPCWSYLMVAFKPQLFKWTKPIK